jgi:hypothetical protein
MEISILPLPELTARSNTNTAGLIPVDPAQSLIPVEGELPSTIVTLNVAVEPPPVYQEPAVIVTYLRNNTYKGEAAVSTSQTMMQSLNQLRDGKSKFSISSLFSQIGALSRETTEYRNEARDFRLPPKSTVDKFSPDFTRSNGTRVESAFLNIKTREGDNIKIQLNRNSIAGSGNSVEFSFVVDGELSEKEQQALAALAEKLGAMGDEFFRMDTTELRGLKDIDTDAISYFSFTLQRPDPINDTYVDHNYEFSIDDIAKTQTLRASDVKGYSVDINMQLQGLVEGKRVESEVLQQYIDLINKAGDDSDTPNASKRFMLDAFESMFFGSLTVEDKNAGDDIDRAESAIAAFDSGLADFKATFRSPVFHNPNYYTQVASMVLTLEQKTSVEKNGDNLFIKQESSYDFINHHFEGFPVEYLKDIGGYYTYTTEHVAGSISRLLSMTNDVVNNIWIEQDVGKDVKKTSFENYMVKDDDSFSYSDQRIQEYAELLKKYNVNKQQSAIEELLQSSKEKLFLDI